MKYLIILVTGLLMLNLSSSYADEPKVKDFAEGITLTVNGTEPLLELSLPDRVYATITQWNIADLRVFNADGDVVPHAFCNFSHPESPIESMSAPLYSIDTPRTSSAAHNNITLRTADGTELTVQSGADPQNDYAFRANASYILDVRKTGFKISSIELDWSVPSGASETTVNILSSTDLSHWQPLVSNAKLLRATGKDDSTLELSRVQVPDNYYEYLRIEHTGDALNIKGATIQHKTAYAAQAPVWYSAGPPHGSDDVHELNYENTRLVPVRMLRIMPRVENSTMHVTVQSRDREDHPWQTRWQGEIFNIHYNDQTRYNDIAVIEPVSAREWRLLFADNVEPPASAPSFEFGYTPTLVNFLAQGKGPYTLAYGNARITTSSARACEEMLTGAPHAFRQELLGTVTIGPSQIFAGKDALVIRKQIPTRTLLLWGILLIGAAVIMKIAFSMLKTGKQHEQD
jgi:hypothetical protein